MMSQEGWGEGWGRASSLGARLAFAVALRQSRRTSETEMSSRMFRMRFALGCRLCPSSFPNGAVSSVARQLGHRGFSYLRNALRSTSCPQSRWKQCPQACRISTTSAPGPGRGSGSMHTVHSSGPSTCERVWQHTRIVRDAGAASATEEGPSRKPRGFFFAIVLILHVVSRFNARGRGTLWNPFLPSLKGAREVLARAFSPDAPARGCPRWRSAVSRITPRAAKRAKYPNARRLRQSADERRSFSAVS